jgi:hypothetical protein
VSEARALLFIASLGAGCAGTGGAPETSPEPPIEAPEPAGAVEFESCKAHLDAIAKCFFEVVTQIQREPAEGEPMATFLGMATRQIAAARVHDACSPLGLTAESRRLLLRDRSEVSVEKREDSHDNMVGGVSVWHITYRFSSPTCPEYAEASIDLHMGGPVE